MRAHGYRFAVEWIVYNYEPNDLDLREIEHYDVTLLVADLFEKTPREVAEDVAWRRKEFEKEEGRA